MAQRRGDMIHLRQPMKFFLLAATLFAWPRLAADRPGIRLKIFQFPPNMIPRIDGNTDDWKIVPDSYAIGMDQLIDDGHPEHKPDPKDLDVKVKVGWVKGLNRLYFLYEAYDNYWDFSSPACITISSSWWSMATFPAVPLIERFQPTKELSERDAHFSMHGVQAQNYHIMTPAVGKDWALAWGCNSYVKELPYANAAYNYNFKPGESGKLILEFWITPFDYAGCEGPQRAVRIGADGKQADRHGLGRARLRRRQQSESHAFWNLSRQHTMYGKADELVDFRLMPLEPQFVKFEANWSFNIFDMDRTALWRFSTNPPAKSTSWKWTFGDGATSTEQNPDPPIRQRRRLYRRSRSRPGPKVNRAAKRSGT